MIFKLFNYFLILFLLQSCSGGRIGNFLELSFSNITEDELKNIENNFKSEKVLINNKNLKDSNDPEIIETNKDFQKPNNKINIQQKQNLKSDENTNKKKKVIKQNLKSDENINKKKKVIKQNLNKENNKKIETNYDPQSYRVIIILKGVDPTDPSQKFSNVLKNANIFFEIEKIERFQENDFKN